MNNIAKKQETTRNTYTVHLTVSSYDENELIGLQNDIAPFGISLEYEPGNDGTEITFQYNPVNLKMCLRHAAGRRKTQFNSGYKWKDIQRIYADGEKSGLELAEMCRMSKSTFYRRLAHYIEYGAPDDDFH